jgi:histidine triad (HIT) family protein
MKVLFRLGSSSIGRKLVGWLFAYLSFLLPVKRLYPSDQVLVFRHPNPSYAVHVLLIPKKILHDLDDLCAHDAGMLIEIFQIAQKLAPQLGLTDSGYRLIVNGGAYQNIPQMHFHLIPASDA